MGNQHGSHAKGGVVIEETLESMQKEKQRDEHLKNLEFKRSKSIRKSIAKRLKGGKKRKDQKSIDQPDAPPSSGASEIGDSTSVNLKLSSDVISTQPAATNQRPSSPSVISAASSSNNTISKKPPAKVFEKEDKKSIQSSVPSSSTKTKHKTERIYREDANRKPLVGEPQPFPTHVQESFGDGSKPRNMDRLRRSLRSSIRKKKNKDNWTDLPQNSNNGAGSKMSSDGGKPHQWQSDEISVRSGNCNFHVKYLGSVEVFDSRGMQVCEEAIKVLKGSKRKSVRSNLHVSGDGLKVVDDDTKGLIVDQTIEKVSFCAPDRNYERGFSYICRDGTTRRWMCHGFIAIKESGERLSHAVGCAFAICLERKQKRDRECTVSMNFDSSSSSFTRLGSFRQATITERLQDPQVLKPSPKEPPVEKEKVSNPYAIARPHATDLMYQRQTSFKGLGQLNQVNSPFKRQLSLRLTELPSTVARQKSSLDILVPHQEALSELESSDIPDPILPEIGDPNKSGNTNGFRSHLEELSTLIIDNPSQESSMENQMLSSTHSASIFENAGLTHFELPPRQTSAFSGISPRALATVPENETTTPIEEAMQQPMSLPPIPLTSNHSSSLATHVQKQSSFDPFSSLEQDTFFKNITERPPSPRETVPSLQSKSDTLTTSAISKSEHSNNQTLSQSKPDPLSNVKPVVYDNPWDLVPDQPNINVLSSSTSVISNQDESEHIQRLTVSGGKSYGSGSKNSMQPNSSNCDSSSGISSSSATSLQRSANIFGVTTMNGDGPSSDSQHYHQLWQDEVPGKNEKSNGYENNTTKSHNGKMKSNQLSNGNQPSKNSQNAYKDSFAETGSNSLGDSTTTDIKSKNVWTSDVAVVLDDPFDAEWAALATREKNPSPAAGLDKSQEFMNDSVSSTNPFTSTPSQIQTPSSTVKAFELQL